MLSSMSARKRSDKTTAHHIGMSRNHIDLLMKTISAHYASSALGEFFERGVVGHV